MLYENNANKKAELSQR